MHTGIQRKVFTVAKGLSLLERPELHGDHGAHNMCLLPNWLSVVQTYTNLSNTLKVQCESFILFMMYIQSVIPILVVRFLQWLWVLPCGKQLCVCGAAWPYWPFTGDLPARTKRAASDQRVTNHSLFPNSQELYYSVQQLLFIFYFFL